MHRAIQPFGPTLSEPVRREPPTGGGLPGKTMAEYLRALRRRWWLAALVAMAVIVPGASYVARRPNVYRAFTFIRIEPPSFDERVVAMVPHGGVGQSSNETRERYVPNRVAELKSRWLAEKVVVRPELNVPPVAAEGVANELVSGLSWRRHPDSNNFDVYLEGTDPVATAARLNALLKEFEYLARTESTAVIDKSKQSADKSIKDLEQELDELEAKIVKILHDNPEFAPGGKSLLEERYVQANSLLTQKQLHLDDLREQQMLGLLGPERSAMARSHPQQQRIDSLVELKERLNEQLESHRRVVKKYGTDPAPRILADKLSRIEAELGRLRRLDVPEEADLTDMLMAHSDEEIVGLHKEVQDLLKQMQDTMPQYTEYLGLLRARQQKEDSLVLMRNRLAEFDLLAQTMGPPVHIFQPAVEPTAPVKPNRPLYLALVVMFGVALGVGLVCGLESLDARVKVPEHLSEGLRLPLLGIIPRMRRLAETHRGGHLWTLGAPRSVGADAFRNLRASLLGAVGPQGRPAVTLLVTSAKAGEGKSTTALNLAATFARSGERTLLIDVDLRRTSLAEVFDPDAELGLVDVLRGDLPWQRTLVRTDVPNLDFMPTGDPTDIPIEVLGTLELRQLLEAVSGHYHRVILDGPAVLGLADCRMLGRVVDGAILVVRCGSNDLNPLRRAKQMLELSSVRLVGVVFNDLDDDLANWSHAPTLEIGGPRRAAARSLEAPAVTTSP
jgi:capsular exopolysaccharide synthesis family protein